MLLPAPLIAKLFDRGGVPNASRALRAAELPAYSGVGRVECPGARGRSEFNTGFLIGRTDRMMTTAHSFVDPASGVRKDPARCRAVFYDARGMAVERIGIVRVASRWDENALVGDPSNDVALLALARPPDSARKVFARRPAGRMRLNDLPVTMIGFHEGPSRILRESRGAISTTGPRAFHYRWSRREKAPFRNGAGTVVGDYHASLGSSGAPVLDSAGRVVAMQQGDTVNRSARFDKDENYNLAILVDDALLARLTRSRR